MREIKLALVYCVNISWDFIFARTVKVAISFIVINTQGKLKFSPVEATGVIGNHFILVKMPAVWYYCKTCYTSIYKPHILYLMHASVFVLLTYM